jgi:peptide/nickel transport system permease protein
MKYFLRRMFLIPVTLLIITAMLYGIIMLEPAESRAMLYWPKSERKDVSPEVAERTLERIINKHGLDDPYPAQYSRWLSNVIRGNWGWSPAYGDVLGSLLERTPATAELTLYSILIMIPLGLLFGVVAGAMRGRLPDNGIRLVSFISTSIPPFILAFVLLAFFYVSIRWFPPGRLDISDELFVSSSPFKTFTGLLTIDGLLNFRPDISLEALRHLVLPVFTLSLAHWAVLTRITRTSMISELGKPYVIAARARGISEKRIVWRHMFRNAIIPGITSSGLSAAFLVTGVFVVEIIFRFPGVSELITFSFQGSPDAPVALGFAIYSVLMVLSVMLIMDLLQAMIDPRIREGIHS